MRFWKACSRCLTSFSVRFAVLPMSLMAGGVFFIEERVSLIDWVNLPKPSDRLSTSFCRSMNPKSMNSRISSLPCLASFAASPNVSVILRNPAYLAIVASVPAMEIIPFAKSVKDAWKLGSFIVSVSSFNIFVALSKKPDSAILTFRSISASFHLFTARVASSTFPEYFSCKTFANLGRKSSAIIFPCSIAFMSSLVFMSIALAAA